MATLNDGADGEFPRGETADGGAARAIDVGDDRADSAATSAPPVPDAPTNSAGDPPGPPGAVVERLEAIEALIETRIGRVLEVFENKLAYDQSKEVQVDRLHEELQGHRSDLVGRTIRPLVRDAIRLHDDIGKLVSALEGDSSGELSPEEFLRLLEGLQQDVELMLEHNGVEAYREEAGGRFDPGRQKILRTVASGERETEGIVAESVRPGFELGGQVVERERVTVYRFEPSAGRGAADAAHPSTPHRPDPTEGAGGEPADDAEDADGQGQED